MQQLQHLVGKSLSEGEKLGILVEKKELKNIEFILQDLMQNKKAFIDYDGINVILQGVVYIVESEKSQADVRLMWAQNQEDIRSVVVNLVPDEQINQGFESLSLKKLFQGALNKIPEKDISVDAKHVYWNHTEGEEKYPLNKEGYNRVMERIVNYYSHNDYRGGIKVS